MGQLETPRLERMLGSRQALEWPFKIHSSHWSLWMALLPRAISNPKTKNSILERMLGSRQALERMATLLLTGLTGTITACHQKSKNQKTTLFTFPSTLDRAEGQGTNPMRSKRV